MAAIVAHPLRARCWIALSERVASPTELKTEFGAGIGDVSYHVGVLEKLGHVELVDTKARRGAIEHYYRAIERPLVDDDEYATMTPAERAAFAEPIVQLAFADAAVAFDHRTFGRRANNCVLRMPATVDAEGFAEMGALYNELLERLTEIAATSANRMAADPTAKSIPISAVAMFFEMPESKHRTDREPSS